MLEDDSEGHKVGCLPALLQDHGNSYKWGDRRKTDGQGGNRNVLERKNGKNAHLLVGGCGVSQKPVEPSERREKRLKPKVWGP